MTCSYETERIAKDRDRLAHNPEVAGSNPVPATSGNGPGSGGHFHARWTRIGTHHTGVLVTCPVPSLLDSSLLQGVMACPFLGGASGSSFAKALIRSPLDVGAHPKGTPQPTRMYADRCGVMNRLSSGAERFFLELVAFAGCYCRDVDLAAVQLYLQPRQDSWIVERGILPMAVVIAHDFDVAIAVPQGEAPHRCCSPIGNDTSDSGPAGLSS